MNIVNNKSFTTSIKYIYLSMCLLCFFKHFCSSIGFIDTFLITLESYLPIIGIFLVFIISHVKININNNIIIILCLIYCFATAVGNGVVNNEYIFLIILALLFYDEDSKKLFQFLLIFNIAFLLLNLILSHFNYFPNNNFTRGEIIRHSFNFFHPNSLGMFCLSIYTLICYVLKKYKILIMSTGCFIFYFSFYYVNSRTSGLLILFILILHILYWIFSFIFNLLHFKPKILNTFFKYIVVSIPFLCFAFSIYSSFAYSQDNSFLLKIDSLLSTRLYLQHNAILNDGIPLLGIQKVFVNTPIYNIIDNFYMQLIYRYGLLFEIILLPYISYFLFYNLKRENTFTILWLTLTWSLFGISEPFGMYFCFNPFLLLLFKNHSELLLEDKHE